MSKNKAKSQTKILKQVPEYGQINEEIKKIVPPAPNIFDNSEYYQSQDQPANK